MPEHSPIKGGGLAARPALRCALLLAAGILISEEGSVPSSVSYVLLGTALLVAVTAGCFSRRSPTFRRTSDILLHASVILLGCTLQSLTREEAYQEQLHPPDVDYPVLCFGLVATPPTPTRNGYSFVLQTDSISSTSWTDAGRRDVVVYARRSTSGDTVRPGQRIRLEGTLERFPGPRNPGEHDYGATLGLLGISAVVGADRITVRPGDAGFTLRSLTGEVQATLYAWIDELHPGEHASFVKGIVLGYRADLPEDLREAFMTTGTVHILAVSGSNVALIGLIVMVCSGFFRVGRTARAGITIAGMLFYMLVTGGGPSITRATIMGIIVVLIVFVPRKGDVLQSLGLSACVLLLIDPRNLFDAGFLLSYASVVWIVTGHPVVQDLVKRLPEEFRESYVLRSGVELAGVSLLAQLGTLPISAYAFGQISLVSVLVNLAVVPLSAVVLVLGVTELAFFALLPPLALPYAAVNGVIIDVLLGLVRRAAGVPFAAVGAEVNGPAEAVLMYAVCVSVVWFAHPRVRNRALIAAAVCLNVIVWHGAISNREPALEWIAVDVGQGDAHVLLTPGGRAVMIDAAPSERTAERALVPLLRHLGIGKLDYLVLSHPHWDHIAGVGVLLDHLPVRTLVVSDSVRFRPDVRERMRATGTRIQRLRTGDVLDLGEYVRCYALHPTVVTPWSGWNDNSLVLQVRYGATTALFTGDLEEDGEDIIASRYGPFLQSQVLKAGHHGSKTSSSARLLDVVRPSLAVVSVGWRNRFGHPSEEREREMAGRGIRILKTSDRGAAWLRSDGREWRTVGWRHGP